MDNAHKESIRLLRITLIAAILFPLALFGYAVWLDYESVEATAQKQIDRTTDVLNEHALKVLEGVERAIFEINEMVREMSDEDISAQQANLHERLGRIVGASSQIKSLWVFGRNGKALVNSLSYPVDGTDFSDRDYFRAHVEKDVGTYVGKVLRPRPPYGGAPFFGVSRRRTAADGSFAGVIQASILPEYFEGFYEKLAREPGAYASLVHDDGMLLARFPALGRDAKLAEDGPLYQAMLRQPTAGKVTLLSAIDGQARTVVYHKVPGFPVFVLAGLSIEAMRQQWMAQVWRKVLFGLPATAALIAIVGLTLRRTRRFYHEAAARNSAEAALKQAQRMEALGQLTGGVAHDFNNLLMIIAGSVERLKSRLSDPKAMSRSLSMIETAVQRGSGLTRQLLSFSRRQGVAPRVIDLGARIRSFADVLRQSLRGDIRIHFAIPNEVFPAFVDENEFEIAILNLVLNGRDAMPHGGDIEVAIQRAVRIGDGGVVDAKQLVIKVSDSGIGIPDTIGHRVFEPFFTTKPADKGTGLGLSQVYGFATQAGGSVRYDSKAGRGTVFTLTLPESSEPLALDQESPTLRPADFHGRVLLVEDNADVAAVARDYLEQSGCQVIQADTAEKALDILFRDAQIKVLFSDIVMPGMNGVDLARRVREYFPHVRIILASGYSDKASEALAEGFKLLNKPYSLDTLRNALASSSASSAAA